MGFGDVRHHCPGATDAAMCPSTRGLTLKNTGSVPIQLIAVSGSRPGDRQEAAPRTVRVGADTVVRPRAGDAFLYDIVLRCNGGHAKAAVVAMA
ncbi:hypothetical protein [Streptomyces sp. NPDC088733]|uniref:hypothetical protein n=1 Tax=Streptomyces sp. NPDC088733 TaxID=3365880 RepID=UPI0037FA66DE